MEDTKEENQAVAHRRRSRREVDEWVERFRESGQSQVDFGKAHGINVGTLRQWIYRRRNQESKGAGNLLAVKVVEPSGHLPAVIVRFPGGVEVEFAGGVEVAELQKLISPGGKGLC